MDLVETYPRIRGSIVAFVPRVFRGKNDGSAPDIPPIFGTGFVLHEDGIIATNNHVVDAFKKYVNPPGDDENSWPVCAMLFHQVDEGIAEIPLEVLGVGVIKTFEPGEVYYGPPKPDLAKVHVKARGLPEVTVDGNTEIKEGMIVATAGFPMGSDMLMAPGWLHQLGPTLQQGIVSAVHPFAAPKPHGFSLNIMVQGGASGSPVFLPETGAVVGAVYASVEDPTLVLGSNDEGQKEPVGLVHLPTVISHAVPAHYLLHLLNDIPHHPEFAPHQDAQTIEEMIDAAKLVSRFSEQSTYVPIDDPNDGPQLTIRQSRSDN